MIAAAKKISAHFDSYIFIKGGHLEDDEMSADLLYQKGLIEWLETARIANENTHGTGCTISSAIASNLAKGDNMQIAVQKAKEYITNAIAANLDLGRGQGPIDHTHALILKG